MSFFRYLPLLSSSLGLCACGSLQPQSSRGAMVEAVRDLPNQAAKADELLSKREHQPPSADPVPAL